jgi:hypothetical protein
MTAAGHTCPYCRSPVKTGDDAKECPSCGAEHHADCWAENDGCSVIGCAASPAARKAAGIVLPPIEEPGAVVVVDVAADAERGDGGRSLKRPLMAAAAVVAVVAIGIGAAFAIRAADKGGKIEVAEGVAASNAPSAAHPSTPAADLSGPRDSGEFTDAEVVAGARQVLVKHHELLQQAAGDPSSPYARQAYALLSARKRAAETAEGTEYGQSGFEFWITKREEENLRIGESVCLPGVVALRSPGYWDPKSGVAMVYVDFGSYAGFTWVLYEHGHWTYDAGYGHVPSREAIWESRQDVLFQATGQPGC